MANGHGGKRSNAGRKPKAEKYERQINAAEKRIADRLPQVLDNLFHLANGGYERVKEKYERVPIRDGEGEIAGYEFVLIERTVETADKDRAANIYLIDRILGKATERQEIEQKVSGEIEITDKARQAADAELEAWRQQMNEKLLSLQSASPTLPIS